MFAPIRNERGNWSLIGLLVGVAVMMLLVYVLVLPKLNTTDRAVKEGGLANQQRGQTVYGKSIDKAKETECASNLRQIRQMIQYEKTQMSETGQLPATLREMKISPSIQACPISKQPYVYTAATGEIHCTTPGHEKLSESPLFKKILIANRGEIAVRIIRACKEMKIATVAVYSQADANSMHVRLADEAVCVGPPPNKESYLNMPNIISAAMITGADAIHPGYAYFSEQPSFAEACEACNLVFIGPKAAAIEKMGNKSKAREIMQAANVPVIPGTKGNVDSEQEAYKTAQQMGYPMLIKASSGGGGRGIRLVQNDEELIMALKMAKAEAESAFGDPSVYIEKYIEDPRHIEVQVLADQHGHYAHLGERECSIQTARHQKMVEESPSVAITPALRQKMGDAAIRAAKAAGYSSAGTVEFLLDKDGSFYFMEMNTRVQVEHPVTEAVTGIDIVREMILVASGEKLSFAQKDVQWNGHSIECRITAEDPDNGFKPSVGKITTLALPGGLGVRIDTHIYAGYDIPPYYDPLLLKLIVWGKDRNEAIARMSRSLDEVEIGGLKTNTDFHKKIMGNAYFRKGDLTTNFLHRRMLNSAV